MNHSDHVDLLRGGVEAPGGEWADLGAGTGAFTLALAELIGAGSILHAVDKNAVDLRQLTIAFCERFPDVNLRIHIADFNQPLGLSPLDGALMANSLHFVKDKAVTLKNVRAALKPGGRLLIVEYDTDHGNLWVPYPFSYDSWERMAAGAGFAETRRLATKPSRFLGRFYSAVSLTA